MALYFLLLLSTPSLLFGYTDPGSGVLLYQALIASLAGFGWTFRKLIRRFFTRPESGTSSAQE